MAVRALPRNTLLGACPHWPVLFSFPPDGMAVLAELRRWPIGEGSFAQAASLRMILSALIIGLPEDPDRIAAFSNYSPAAGAGPPPGSPGDLLRRRTQVRLPAPVTLRLNRLIEIAGDETQLRCSRTAIVVSMMHLARAQGKDAWRDQFRDVLRRPAIDAVPAVDAGKPQRVLRPVKPLPGPRPQGTCGRAHIAAS